MVGRLGSIEGIEINMAHHFGTLRLGDNRFHLFRLLFDRSRFGFGRSRGFRSLLMPLKADTFRLEFQTFILTELLNEQGILFVGYLGVGVGLYRETFLLKEFDSRLNSHIQISCYFI